MNRSKNFFIFILAIWIIGCCRSEQLTTNRTKIFLVGLDGATWRVIKPLVEKGELPNIKYLINNGSYGKIDSTLESMESINSAVIWTTIATGKQPRKHGILDWAFLDDRLKMIVPYKSYHCKVKKIWEILSENKKDVGVYRWLLTYPPKKVNGFIVSDYYKDDMPVIYPERLSLEFRKIPHSKNIPFPPNNAVHNHKDDDIRKGYQGILMDLENIIWLQRNRRVDFFALYLNYLDTIQHYFWKFMEPYYFMDKAWNLTEEDISKYKDVIKKFYQEVDRVMGRLIENLEEGTVVIIVSDHGFRPNALSDKRLSFNRILSKIGLLNFKEKSTNPDPLRSKVLSYESKGLLYIVINLPSKKSNQFIDLKNTLVNLISNMRIDNGAKIYEIIDKETDKNGYDLIIKEAVDAKDYLDRNLYIGKDKYPISDFIESLWIDISGEHDRYDGIVILYDISGKKICRKKELNGASVLDITPTILYLMGLPIAKDMDGKVLTSAIAPCYLKKNPIQYIESYGELEPSSLQYETGNSYDEKLLERLRSLGYVN